MWKQRIDGVPNSGFDRDEYGRDRARIIHSAFFRRLQGKTQVLGLGESDFYRTRLTHSIEVAQIGNGISEFLRSKYKEDSDFCGIIPEQNLIESIGLAHDIGHPPFGHGGEVALNYCMRESYGFEGNAQTLRICTKLGEYSDTNGLNLTRRTLLGLIKYPCCYSDVVNESSYRGVSSLNLDSYKPPKCIFNCDKDVFDWVVLPVKKDAFKFISSKEVDSGKHKKPLYKSFDCSIMELADDIAYGVHDLEDAIALGLVTESSWRNKVVAPLRDAIKKYPISSNIEDITEKLFSGNGRRRKSAVSFLVNYFIVNSECYRHNIFSHDLLDCQVRVPGLCREELDMFKEYVVGNVIKTPEVQTLEYKGQQMIVRLFEVIANNPSRLLPKKYHEKFIDCGDDLRVICDYLAGTTDDYATRLYHKIFTPSSGSVFDRL